MTSPRQAAPEAESPAELRLTVLLFAAYREALGKRIARVGVPAGSTVQAVFGILAADNPHFEALRPYTTFALNREVVPPATEVHDGDELAFLQPVSGGASDHPHEVDH